MIKNLSYKSFLWLIPILAVYFISRLQNIQQMPVFGDEAIYIRWAQVIKNVETLRFIPLTDGKQPLFMWINSVTLRLFSDPLLSGRIISIFAGAGTITLIFIISFIFINLSTAIIGSILYLCLPFTFFFDRLATPDNLLSFFGIISLFISILLAKYPRFDLSLLLGFSLGLAWLTKSPAVFFILLSYLSFLIINPKNIKFIYYPVISTIIAFVIYNILRLGPQFHQIALRNQDYVWPLSEIIRHPLDPLLPHLKDVLNLSQFYISLPLIFLAFILIFIYAPRLIKNRLFILLFIWSLLPLLANSMVAKVFTARYILFTIPPLILALSIIYQKIISHKYKILNILVMIPNLYTLFLLSTNFLNIKMPSTETGYNSDWTSGWGIKPASQYLISRSKEKNVIVGTEGYFGTLPDGLQIYTEGQKNLTVIGVGNNLEKLPDSLVNAYLYGDEVYILLNQTRNKLNSLDLTRLELVSSYPKPKADSLQLYRLR